MSAFTPDLDCDPRRPELRDAVARNVRVGILEGDDHTANAGGDERVRAGPGPALVRTRFEGDPHGGAADIGTRSPCREQARPPRRGRRRAPRRAFVDGARRARDDAADAGIGRCSPTRAAA